MSKKWEELTDEFDVESEDGKRFHLLEHTTMVDATSLTNPNARPIPSVKTVRTSDGYLCKRIDDDNWEIIELGLKVKRVRR